MNLDTQDQIIPEDDDKGVDRKELPVSYTHLPLPTIYSV